MSSAAVIVSGMDFDLEAFIHNPADGSFLPLASQLSENTKYLNLTQPRLRKPILKIAEVKRKEETSEAGLAL